jgi:hypothetical protein
MPDKPRVGNSRFFLESGFRTGTARDVNRLNCSLAVTSVTDLRRDLHCLRLVLRESFEVGLAFSIRLSSKSNLSYLNVNTGKSHQQNLFVGVGIVWHFGR